MILGLIIGMIICFIVGSVGVYFQQKKEKEEKSTKETNDLFTKPRCEYISNEPCPECYDKPFICYSNGKSYFCDCAKELRDRFLTRFDIDWKRGDVCSPYTNAQAFPKIRWEQWVEYYNKYLTKQNGVRFIDAREAYTSLLVNLSKNNVVHPSQELSDLDSPVLLKYFGLENHVLIKDDENENE